MNYFFIIGQILFGAYFVMSGFNHLKNLKSYSAYAGSKGVPMPTIAVAASGLMIIIGGAAVLLGIGEVCGLYLIGLFLIGVTPMMHAYWKIADPMQKMGERVNFFKNIGLLGAVLMMLALHTGTVITWSLF